LLLAIGAVGTILLTARVALRGHGPYWTTLDTVQKIAPPHRAEFGRGALGVVRPHFARRYLVQAYRVLSGGSPLPATAFPDWQLQQPQVPKTLPVEDWINARNQVLGLTSTPDDRGQSYFARYRDAGNYQAVLNCPDDAYANAAKTLKERSARFGATSAEARDWVRAQVAVFRNCSEADLVLPEDAPATAPALVRADRAYQIAAAYFYSMQFGEAEGRFRDIAQDTTSPWRPYGRYLAARSLIRRATLSESDPLRTDEIIEYARLELEAVINDPEAAGLHHSAKGLLDHLAARFDPLGRLHVVAAVLASSPSPTEQDIVDYQWLMDRLIGDTVDYDYVGPDRGEITRDDLDDWVLAIQGRGQEALDRALARWNETQSPLWLVPVMWKLPADHPMAAAVLQAASRVGGKTPAYPTLSFLRVRLLMRMGRQNEARSLLATLPATPRPDFQAEAVNLLQAERLMLARSLEELLVNAPRAIVTNFTSNVGTPPRIERKTFEKPAFDEDAATIFSIRLPLTRLVAASTAQALPGRLRLRVAAAAFARAIVLRRDDLGVQLATVLRGLAPALQNDLDRYINAANAEDRHLAAVLLLLRTPGVHANIRGLDDDRSYGAAGAEREFSHESGRNWWCGFDLISEPDKRHTQSSELIELLYPDHRVPFPAFVTTAEQGATERELRATAAVGSGRSYVTAEAIKWAAARPTDPNAAEALARAVEGWRWSACGDDQSGSELPRRAFQTLHSKFPQSDWAKRTKYWFN
jgi:hypothetical protein